MWYTVVIAFTALSLCWCPAMSVNEAFCDQFLTSNPTRAPTQIRTHNPTRPTFVPTASHVPTAKPSKSPTARPTAFPSIEPTYNPTGDSQQMSYCDEYTAFSNGNVSICTFYTRTSDYVIASSCSQNGGTCAVLSSDTDFALLDEAGNIVATNDDRCGFCSAITFKPASSSCSVYYLHQFCYPGKHCSAMTAITNGYVLSNPTYSPSVPPTNRPVVTPTARPSNPTAVPSYFEANHSLLMQLSALYDLYEATGGESWKVIGQWDLIPDYLTDYLNDDLNDTMTEMTEKTFTGVTIKNDNVVSIKLQSNILVGTLPESLGNLTALQVLDLAYNFLSGTLPSSLTSLASLQKINVGQNFLSGTVADAFLDDLPLLTQLMLRVNIFTGTLPLPRVRSTSDLILQDLELYNNFLTGTISPDYCLLPNADAFLVASNSFSCYTICNPVTDGSVYDYISGDEVPVCSGYQDQSLCALQDAFDVNSHVPSVSKTPITVTVSDRYIEGFQSDDGFLLIHTDSYNYYQDNLEQYEVSFENSILRGDLRKVDNRYFPFNFVVRIGVSIDGSDFKNTYYCGYCTVGKSYFVSQGITFVESGASYPGTNGASAFSSTYPYLSISIYVMSDGNYALYNIPGYEFVVTEVSDTTTSLWACTDNAVYTTNPCDWFGVTCDGSFVSDLSLPSLGLRAQIPSEIGMLTTLTTLDLSKNSLYGSLPTTLGQLSNLVSVDLSNNVLTGVLPTQLVGLVNIVEMYLYANQLSGTLPNFIGYLTTLKVLSLQSNNFVDRVPYVVCHLTNTTIRLDGNDFACYDTCGAGDENITNIRYGAISVCAPTPHPTYAPKKPFPTAYIAIIVVASVIGLCMIACVAAFWHYHQLQEAKYIGFPVQKSIRDGSPVSEQFVLTHMDSARRMVQGKTALQMLLERLSKDKEAGITTEDVSEEVLFVLLENSLHFDPDSGKLFDDVELHNYAWADLVQNDTDIALKVVERVLLVHDNHAELLAQSQDKKGRLCADIASPRCREAINQSVMLFRKFELKPGPPEHKSATSLVKFATMHVKDEKTGETLRTPVALKFMKHKSQYTTELNARANAKFSSEYVIMIIEAFDGESQAEYDSDFRFSAKKKGFEDYPFCIVMDVADNNLQRIILQQHIAGHDWDYIKLITKSLCGCLQHLHSRNIVHGDLKPLNIVLLNNGVRLIDFDASSRFVPEFDGHHSHSPVFASPPASASTGPLEPVTVMGIESGDVMDDHYLTVGRNSIDATSPGSDITRQHSPLDSSFENENEQADPHQVDHGEFAGAKYSSAYLPPELFFEKSAGKVIVKSYTKSPTTGLPTGVRKRKMQTTHVNPSTGELDDIIYYDHPAGYSLVRASPAQDMWALGAILYLLCTGVTLFQASVEDNIPTADMLDVYNWTDANKEAKLSVVTDKYARNLLSLLLNADPNRRIGPDRVISHPFLSGKHPERLMGEEAKFDVFLSYRVDSDKAVVRRLCESLKAQELRVWLDQDCLQPGQPWEDGFCDGLVNSACFVCLLSKGAINHPTKPWQNFGQLEAGSRCDNVLLEWRLALELRDRQLVEGIFPVFIGDVSIGDNGEVAYSDYFGSGCHPRVLPDTPVHAVEAKLREHLGRQGLGLPLEPSMTVKDICGTITGNQGGFLSGQPDAALEVITQAVVAMRKAIRNRRSEDQTALRTETPGAPKMSMEERNDFLLEENQKLREENEALGSLRAELELLRHDHERLALAEMEIDRLNRELAKTTHSKDNTKPSDGPHHSQHTPYVSSFQKSRQSSFNANRSHRMDYHVPQNSAAINELGRIEEDDPARSSKRHIEMSGSIRATRQTSQPQTMSLHSMSHSSKTNNSSTHSLHGVRGTDTRANVSSRASPVSARIAGSDATQESHGGDATSSV